MRNHTRYAMRIHAPTARKKRLLLAAAMAWHRYTPPGRTSQRPIIVAGMALALSWLGIIAADCGATPWVLVPGAAAARCASVAVCDRVRNRSLDAYIVMAYSYGVYSYGVYIYGVYSYGVYSYGLYSYGPM